jgi:hypothetical protein
VFIRMGDYTCMSIYVSIMFLKLLNVSTMFLNNIIVFIMETDGNGTHVIRRSFGAAASEAHAR